MGTRTSRLIVAGLLVAAGIAGGFFVFANHLKAQAALAADSDVAARLERMVATVSDIASSQQAYVAPGQPDEPWLERSATLFQQLAADAAAVRPRLRSANAGRVVDELGASLQALIVMNDKAREDLLQGQDLLAADLIFSEGRETVESMISAIRGLRGAEQGAAAAQSAALERQQWAVLGIVGLIWIAGLVMLAPISAKPAPAAETTTMPAPDALETLTIDRAVGETVSTVVSTVVSTGAPIDLAAAADVCTSLARISDASALPDALARAGAVLDARGIIVWMGAGEELFAVLSYGYGDSFVARLGPIRRDAGNATAEAWRSGQMRTVAADVVSHGALAMPLPGVTGCVGVFAAELRNGREEDPSTRAVAAMIAAQLGSIVSAWPAGSAAPATEIAESGRLAASGGA